MQQIQQIEKCSPMYYKLLIKIWLGSDQLLKIFGSVKLSQSDLDTEAEGEASSRGRASVSGSADHRHNGADLLSSNASSQESLLGDYLDKTLMVTWA